MRGNETGRLPLLFAIAVLCSAPAAQAGSIGLAWDPVPGASGYRIHFGPASGSYTGVLDVGNVTQFTLWNLDDCTDYYVAAKAYNANGESAQFSGEISGWARPVLSAVPSISTAQGEQITVQLDGRNFHPGSQLSLQDADLPRDATGNPLARVVSHGIVDCNRVQAQIQLEPLARGSRAMQTGSFSIGFEVVAPDGAYGSRPATLDVVFDEQRADINRSDANTRDRVDGKDLVWLAYSYGHAEGAPRYHPDADLDGDGLVDGADLALLATGFGRCWNGTRWTDDACP